MVSQDDHSPQKGLESRPPTMDDLVSLCRELNAQHAQYMIIGGLAMVTQGLTRSTEDIDLLVERTLSNLQKTIQALSTLPDHAAQEITDEDLKTYPVIRIADEITVDLMQEACGLNFNDGKESIDWKVVQGVSIPFANAEFLLKLKQGIREKDKIDRLFLEQKIRGKRN